MSARGEKKCLIRLFVGTRSAHRRRYVIASPPNLHAIRSTVDSIRRGRIGVNISYRTKCACLLRNDVVGWTLMALSSYERTKRKRLKCKVEGRCIDCGKPLEGRFLRCGACQKKDVSRKAAWVKTLVNKCHRCFRPIPEHRTGQTMCGWCYQTYDRKRW